MPIDIITAPFGNVLFFIFFTVLFYAIIGWLSGSFAVGIMAGFLIFVNIAVSQNNVLLTNILYLGMIAILFVTAFRIYGFTMNTNTGEGI